MRKYGFVCCPNFFSVLQTSHNLIFFSMKIAHCATYVLWIWLWVKYVGHWSIGEECRLQDIETALKKSQMFLNYAILRQFIFIYFYWRILTSNLREGQTIWVSVTLVVEFQDQWFTSHKPIWSQYLYDRTFRKIEFKNPSFPTFWNDLIFYVFWSLHGESKYDQSKSEKK